MSGTPETMNNNDRPPVRSLNADPREFSPPPRPVEQARVFNELKRYLDFNAEDTANLRALAPLVKTHLPKLVDRLWREIPQQPGVDETLGNDEVRLARLRISLTNWFDSLFEARHNDDYIRYRAEIGRAQVRIGLPHYYLSAAMDTLRREFSEIISTCQISGSAS